MKRMSAQELRDSFLNFFKERGHKVVSSSSLVPADPTSLFTSAGMQQFVPYLSGDSEPPYKRACSVQKCVRVNDVDEVGDSTHHTFFEMLGNWSFGDYFKEEAIDYALEFLLEECGLDKNRLWITIFEGQEGIPRDDEAEKIWVERGISKDRIFEYDNRDNYWGPVARTGPSGPCSEIFYDLTQEACGDDCHPNCDCGRFVEIWNLVFMEYHKDEEGQFSKLKQHNVDTGLGFERVLALLQGKSSAYQTDLFEDVITKLTELSGKSYEEEKVRFRVICDHLRTVCFLVAEKVRPSNTDRGYVLRMLLRRMLRHLSQMGVDDYEVLIETMVSLYQEAYPELRDERGQILEVVLEEDRKFGKALRRGVKEFNKMVERQNKISGQDAFDLYQNYGFPWELVQEMAMERGLGVNREEYDEAIEEHKKTSRKGAEKKFGGGGKLNPALHTATHLLQSALREILGDHVKQMGSDITEDRLRFDFSHEQALTDKEKSRIEEWINDKIDKDLVVSKEELEFDKALEEGALAFFKEKYPKRVFVYTIDGVSKEVCAGPHVERIGKMGVFQITSEESAGAGIRRIKATLKDG